VVLLAANVEWFKGTAGKGYTKLFNQEICFWGGFSEDFSFTFANWPCGIRSATWPGLNH
jgi:hypothetical protein